MKIGIAFDLKGDVPVPAGDLPDDWQEEFDCPVTINALAAAFRGRGHVVVELGNGRGLVEKLLADPPDLVFNFAEGHGVGRSRESRVPAVCELLGIPYTGSDPATLAVALDKGWARQVVAAEGVTVPDGVIVPQSAIHEFPHRPDFYPRIVKPAWEGSSKGVRGKCVAHNPRELHDAVRRLHEAYDQPVLVEEFIVGDEVTVGMIGNAPPRIFGVMRIVPRTPETHFVYSLEVKRDFRNQVIYECPAPLDARTIAAVERAALASYSALGCRDVARIDFRLRDGVPYFIEANPLPGLNPESSDLVIMAELLGVEHSMLVGMILDAALARIAVSGEMDT